MPKYPLRNAQWGLVFAEERAVIIRDLYEENSGECLTITNDAANVVGEWAPLLNGRRLFYVDTEGRVDELLVSAGGKFEGFAPGFPNVGAAILALRTPEPADPGPIPDRVDAWLRAVIADDAGKALALCPFNWEGSHAPEADAANPYRFRLRIRPPLDRHDEGTWVGGVAPTPIAAIRLALTASAVLERRLIELENGP